MQEIDSKDKFLTCTLSGPTRSGIGELPGRHQEQPQSGDARDEVFKEIEKDSGGTYRIVPQ